MGNVTSSGLDMIKRAPPACALLFLAVFGAIAYADTPEPPLYVATDGVDTGDCLDPALPCRSIDFALRRVGKNGVIHVAAGDYALQNPLDVFYLVSNAIEVRADPGATLVGVPQDFAGRLAERGFRVIADSKSLDRDTVRKMGETRRALSAGAPATACVGGTAGAFPCDNVDLLAHVPDRSTSAAGADIWGFIDLNTNREYAIMSYSTGTAVYDVSDPESPREVGFVDGQTTTWRDIKVYQFWSAADGRYNAYAYVTADGASDGLFVLDLTELPHRISRVNYSGDFTEAHNVYITKAEFSTGLPYTEDTPVLIIAGSDRDDGRFRAYSLANPAAPSFVHTPATPSDQPFGNRLYMHDGASMLVTDSRKDTQCVNAATSPYCDVLFDFNESSLDIWDVTDPADPIRLSRTPYGNSAYSHSGWASEDKQYVYLQDELDERDNGLATTLRVFSIGDLTSPTLAGTWTGPTNAIDHNGFVRGNRYYMSNYARGLSIFDISDQANPSLVGRFDSYPSGDVVGFPGAWGTYPYLPSGNVLISDIDNGFFVVADNTLSVPEGSLSFSAASFGADESQAAGIGVQRAGGTSGAISVGWEVIGATGSTADVSASSGSLSWAAGDGSGKTIDLGLVNDGNVEGLERVLVRLTAPTGGATLSPPNIASLYIGDPGDTPSVDLLETNVEVAERSDFATAIAVVRRNGSASGTVSIDYAISGGDATAGADFSGPTGGTLTWADGDADPKTLEFAIADDAAAEGDEFFELTLSNASGGAVGSASTFRVSILDGTGLNTPPNSVAGAGQTVSSGARVTLDGSGSNDPDGDALTYAWTQTLGPSVALTDADTATASFTAPSVSSDTLLRFELAVSDPGGLGDTSNASVTVRSGSTSSSSGSSGGGAVSLWLLLLAALRLFERVRLDDRLLAVRTR